MRILKAPKANSALCPQCQQRFTPRYSYPHRKPDQVWCSRKCRDEAKRHTPEMEAVQFWDRVQKTDGCWLWTGAKAWTGYGTFSGAQHSKRSAHRYSWFFTHGVMPPRNIDVCHRCDNRLCVRPDHLFLGTRRDNMQDAVAKGKVKSGERHYRAKLTQEQADHIRQFKAQGISTTDLVFMFGVSQATVSLVCRGERWKASV